MSTKEKLLIIFIDIIAVFVLIGLFIFGINNGGNKKSVNTDSGDNDVVTESASANDADDNTTEVSDSQEDMDSDSDLNTDVDISQNSVSDDSVSDDSVSDNSVSDDSVSANSYSNGIFSYALPGAPAVMDHQSGTVVNVSDLNLNNLGAYFVITEIPEDVYSYINGKSYTPNNDISIDDLRYIKVLHFNFEHQIQIGEIIVNASISNEIRDIFMSLFVNEYEIQSMYLPDRYWAGDGNETDKASCDANNTSGFFYRTVNGTTSLSNHAKGLAIDINPQQNPYVSYKNGYPECEHENALIYIDRATELPHLITETDLCYQLFVARGYKWGGNWNSIKDYQHFEK